MEERREEREKKQAISFLNIRTKKFCERDK